MENTISIINDRIERAKEQIMFDMTKNDDAKWRKKRIANNKNFVIEAEAAVEILRNAATSNNTSSPEFPNVETVVERSCGNSHEASVSIEADAVRRAYKFIVGNSGR